IAVLIHSLTTKWQAKANRPVTTYGVLWLHLFTWLVAGLIAVAELAGKKRQEASQPLWWMENFAGFGATSVLIWLFFALYQASRLRFIPRQTTPDFVASHIVVYYISMFLVMGLLALSIWWIIRQEALSRALDWAPALSSVVIALVLALIINGVNVSLVKADIYYKQGQGFEGARQWDNSIFLYKKAIAVEPSEDFYYLFLGRALLEKAKKAPKGPATLPENVTAEQVLRLTPQQMANLTSEDLLRASRAVLLKAQALNPLNTDHTANLGRLYRGWGEMTSDPDRRKELWRKSLEYYQKAVTLSPHAAHLYNEYGLVYFLLGDYEKALSMYEKSLELDQRFDQTYLFLGDLYRQQGDTEKAAAAYKKAVALSPRLVQGWSALGLVYAQLGRITDAITANLKVIQRAPKDLASHRNLAVLYQQAGKLPEALVEAQRALELTPEKDRLGLLILVGDLQLAVGRAAEAEATYQQALQTAPNAIQALQGMARAQAVQGKVEDAIATRNQIAQYMPNDVNNLRAMADLYRQSGRLQEALQVARQARDLTPEGQRKDLDQFIQQLETVLGG
ncbi:MAG TPA: tetratricopeptide repeat protein, partial [Anaerolineae bacterium]|nr:tetratricopeptide repeat protein [Anaerolineae bacterium]